MFLVLCVCSLDCAKKVLEAGIHDRNISCNELSELASHTRKEEYFKYLLERKGLAEDYNKCCYTPTPIPTPQHTPSSCTVYLQYYSGREKYFLTEKGVKFDQPKVDFGKGWKDRHSNLRLECSYIDYLDNLYQSICNNSATGDPIVFVLRNEESFIKYSSNFTLFLVKTGPDNYDNFIYGYIDIYNDSVCKSLSSLVQPPSPTPIETPINTPQTTPMQTPKVSPFQTPYMTPINTHISTPHQTPYQTPYRTPYQTLTLIEINIKNPILKTKFNKGGLWSSFNESNMTCSSIYYKSNVHSRIKVASKHNTTWYFKSDSKAVSNNKDEFLANKIYTVNMTERDVYIDDIHIGWDKWNWGINSQTTVTTWTPYIESVFFNDRSICFARGTEFIVNIWPNETNSIQVICDDESYILYSDGKKRFINNFTIGVIDIDNKKIFIPEIDEWAYDYHIRIENDLPKEHNIYCTDIQDICTLYSSIPPYDIDYRVLLEVTTDKILIGNASMVNTAIIKPVRDSDWHHCNLTFEHSNLTYLVFTLTNNTLMIIPQIPYLSFGYYKNSKGSIIIDMDTYKVLRVYQYLNNRYISYIQVPVRGVAVEEGFMVEDGSAYLSGYWYARDAYVIKRDGMIKSYSKPCLIENGDYISKCNDIKLK